MSKKQNHSSFQFTAQKRGCNMTTRKQLVAITKIHNMDDGLVAGPVGSDGIIIEDEFESVYEYTIDEQGHINGLTQEANLLLRLYE